MRIYAEWLSDDVARLRQVVTVNPEFIVAARKDREFHSVLLQADLATADGIGVLLGARILGQRIRQRLTGVDLTELLAGMQNPAPKLFLLGAAPGIAEKAAGRMRGRYPGVQIRGTFSGSPSETDLDEILCRIEASGANALLVAFGAPVQDKWIARHGHDLVRCGIVLALGVGGTFDYISGTVPRAPVIIRRAGMEWLYRLIRQPWRWRRQLALPLFVVLVLRERLFGKA